MPLAQRTVSLLYLTSFRRLCSFQWIALFDHLQLHIFTRPPTTSRIFRDVTIPLTNSIATTTALRPLAPRGQRAVFVALAVMKVIAQFELLSQSCRHGATRIWQNLTVQSTFSREPSTHAFSARTLKSQHLTPIENLVSLRIYDVVRDPDLKGASAGAVA